MIVNIVKTTRYNRAVAGGVVRIIILYVSLFMIHSCKSKIQYPYDEKGLTLKDKFVYDNQIKINGIYFSPLYASKKYSVMIFYENGYCCCYSCQDIETNCIDTNNFRYMSQTPQYWGVYTITDNTIKIQRVSPNRGIFEKFRIYEETGLILNDTTIHMMYKKYPENTHYVIELNQRYQFMKLDSIPSSENVLMKCKTCK